MTNNQPRSITKKSAQAMATDIQAYWLKRGHMIHVWVERLGENSLARDYAVRSNMSNGLPTKELN